MKVLIIEDEKIAAERLQMLLKAYDASIEVADIIPTIEEAVAWFSHNAHPDLVLLDVQLADGFSFEIFRHINYTNPIIFTTAYHEYAIDAFKYFSVDYLLKPVTFAALEAALDKLKFMYNPEVKNYQSAFKNYKNFSAESYKERFLVKVGQRFIFIKTDDIYYFKSEEKLVYIVDKKNNKFLTDYTLEKLETILDPKLFFRLNRKVIISINSILQVRPYSNKRLQLHLQNSYTSPEMIVSRERVAEFRQWAGQ